MILKTKFLLWSLVLVISVIVLGSVSVWNLVTLRQTSISTTAEYAAMDHAEATIGQVNWLRDAIRAEDGYRYRDRTYFQPIEREVNDIIAQLKIAAESDGGDGAAELDHATAASQHLANAIAAYGDASRPRKPGDAAIAAAELEKLRLSLAGIARMVPISARRQVANTAERIPVRIGYTSVCLLAVLVLSATVHFSQYRMVIRPLHRLRDDMKRSAANGYREPVAQKEDREFQEVGVQFNTLATELNDLYRDLEARVVARSRELVRSERLASVGFLAAGVAHEINNPLTVISGYAELAAKSLGRVMNEDDIRDPSDSDAAEAEAEALSSVLEAQTIIRDEAFRCKEITSRLLSLARGGTDAREPLRLDDVARQVAVLVKGLKRYADRRVMLGFGADDVLHVVANPTEMKQVLLNLTVNALEATPPERGEVRIAGRVAGDWVELWVEDNGKGMSPQTLKNVFEPFFTDKRGVGDPGTGLGLSITHAIIENHAGRITAESDGPGHGSRFTVRLPLDRSVSRKRSVSDVA